MTASFRRDESAGVWVARCHALGVMSQGTTCDEALAALESARAMYLRVCADRGLIAAC